VRSPPAAVFLPYFRSFSIANICTATTSRQNNPLLDNSLRVEGRIFFEGPQLQITDYQLLITQSPSSLLQIASRQLHQTPPIRAQLQPSPPKDLFSRDSRFSVSNQSQRGNLS
jgi:hypothetical protein